MTAAAARDAPRWAQLTYTSYDAGEARGGWRTKQRTGDLDSQEEQYLRSQVSTSLDLVNPLPPFPLPDEIRALPRRLVYIPDAERSGYWHTAAAGQDATGRPGNVFAHAVLDRAPGSAANMLRPVELSSSPDWLCPFGPEQVNAAVLSTDAPRPGTQVTRESVLKFLFDPSEWRIGVLIALLDAVAATRERRQHVVLGVETPDAAALWLGAVCYLTSVAECRWVSFSTFERGYALDAAWQRGVAIAAVPRVDLPVTSGDHLIVIDSAEAVILGDAATHAPHETRAGSRIPVTAWSVLAEAVLHDPELAATTLASLDDTLAEHARAAAFEWPLAHTMRGLRDAFAEVEDELERVLREGGPPPATPIALEGWGEVLEPSSPDAPAGELDSVTTSADLVVTGVGEPRGSAAHLVEPNSSNLLEVWRLASTASTRIVYAGPYLLSALGDTQWLAQSGGPPVVSARGLPRGAVSRLAARTAWRVADLTEANEAGDDPYDVASAALYLLDFAVRTDLPEVSSTAYRALLQLTDDVVAAALSSSAAPTLNAIRPLLDPRVETEFVRPALERLSRQTLSAPRRDSLPVVEEAGTTQVVPVQRLPEEAASYAFTNRISGLQSIPESPSSVGPQRPSATSHPTANGEYEPTTASVAALLRGNGLMPMQQMRDLLAHAPWDDDMAHIVEAAQSVATSAHPLAAGVRRMAAVRRSTQALQLFRSPIVHAENLLANLATKEAQPLLTALYEVRTTAFAAATLAVVKQALSLSSIGGPSNATSTSSQDAQYSPEWRTDLPLWNSLKAAGGSVQPEDLSALLAKLYQPHAMSASVLVSTCLFAHPGFKFVDLAGRTLSEIKLCAIQIGDSDLTAPELLLRRLLLSGQVTKTVQDAESMVVALVRRHFASESEVKEESAIGKRWVRDRWNLLTKSATVSESMKRGY